MKRSFLVSVVMAMVSLSFVYASVPNEDDIVEAITLSSSENYYPSLMLRFEAGDSTLTLTNYHYLYYGYAYQDGYKPLATNPDMDKFLLLASELDVDDPHPDILRELIFVGRDVLRADPFNPKVWNLMAFAYGALGEKESERAAYRRVEMILSTIRATGNGLKEATPMHILMFDHALDLMAAENLIHTRPLVISRTVEYLPLVAPLKLDGQKIKGVYFDFGRVYWNKPDDVTYKRDRTWQFNNLKPKEYK